MQDETVRSYPIHASETPALRENLSDATAPPKPELDRSSSQRSLYESNSRQMLLDHMQVHLKITKASNEMLQALSDDLEKIKDAQAITIKMIDDIRNYLFVTNSDSEAPPRRQSLKLESIDAPVVTESKTRSRSRSITKALTSCVSKTTAMTPRRQSTTQPTITKK